MNDQFGRTIDYIRISVTDRCNLRCRYCMPSCGVESVGHDRILRFDELFKLVELFARSGIKKVKLTGGEPLARKGVVSIVETIKHTPGIEQVTMTSNGILLKEKLPQLVEAGLDGINISMDTLKRDRYEAVTGTDGLHAVLEAIDACMEYPQLKTKINAVTLADWNMDEIADLAVLARDRNMDVRFIEMMPIGLGKDYPGYDQHQVLQALENAFGSAKVYEGPALGNGPAVYFELEGFCGRIGFISAMSHMFCGDCNRVRLTSEGFLKPCLQYAYGVDLRQLLRDGADDESLLKAIEEGIYRKPRNHDFASNNEDGKDDSHMSSIGG